MTTSVRGRTWARRIAVAELVHSCRRVESGEPNRLHRPVGRTGENGADWGSQVRESPHPSPSRVCVRPRRANVPTSCGLRSRPLSTALSRGELACRMTKMLPPCRNRLIKFVLGRRLSGHGGGGHDHQRQRDTLASPHIHDAAGSARASSTPRLAGRSWFPRVGCSRARTGGACGTRSDFVLQFGQ